MTVFIEIEQLIGEPVQREPHFAETVGQLFINIAQLAAARGGVRGHELIIGPPDLLVKGEVGRAAQAAPLRVLVKNAGEKERIIADVRAEQKRLLRRRAGQRDQHIGNVLAPALLAHVRRLQAVHARKSFEKRGDVIAQFPIGDSDISQDVAREDVKIKMRRDAKLAGIGKNRVNQPRIIEDGVARFRVAQQIDEGNVIDPRTRESAHDKVEIRRGEPLPTIRLNHREPSISIGRAAGKLRH